MSETLESKTPESTQQTPATTTSNLSRCELIRQYALKGVSDREALAKKVFARLQKANKVANKKGKAITIETILAQISSIVTVIKAKKQRHWLDYVVFESDKVFRLYKKTA